MPTQAEHIIYAILTGDAGVSSIIGNRVYPIHAPASAQFPFIVYGRNDTERIRHLGGSVGLPMSRVELQIESKDHSELSDLSDKVRRLLDSYNGPVLEVPVVLIYIDGDDEDYLFPNDGTDDGVYVRNQEYVIAHGETATTI